MTRGECRPSSCNIGQVSGGVGTGEECTALTLGNMTAMAATTHVPGPFTSNRLQRRSSSPLNGSIVKTRKASMNETNVVGTDETYDCPTLLALGNSMKRYAGFPGFPLDSVFSNVTAFSTLIESPLETM